MKVSRIAEEEKFLPIILTIETQKELRTLWHVLNAGFEGSRILEQTHPITTADFSRTKTAMWEKISVLD